MDKVKPTVYVFCYDNSEFLKYQSENIHYNCVMLVDGSTLRGREPGKIVRIGRHMERWNYVDIAESIQRYESQWQSKQDEYTNEDEIDYGI